LSYTSYSAGVTDHLLVNWLSPSSTYIVGVIAVVCNGASTAISNTDTITLAACREDLAEDGNNSIANEKEVVSIYPNPASGQFYLNIDRADMSKVMAKIEVLNTLGQVLETEISEVSGGHLTQVINAPDGLSSGIYFVRTFLGGNVYVNKVMVERK